MTMLYIEHAVSRQIWNFPTGIFFLPTTASRLKEWKIIRRFMNYRWTKILPCKISAIVLTWWNIKKWLWKAWAMTVDQFSLVSAFLLIPSQMRTEKNIIIQQKTVSVLMFLLCSVQVMLLNLPFIRAVQSFRSQKKNCPTVLNLLYMNMQSSARITPKIRINTFWLTAAAIHGTPVPGILKHRFPSAILSRFKMLWLV